MLKIRQRCGWHLSWVVLDWHDPPSPVCSRVWFDVSAIPSSGGAHWTTPLFLSVESVENARLCLAPASSSPQL